MSQLHIDPSMLKYVSPVEWSNIGSCPSRPTDKHWADVRPIPLTPEQFKKEYQATFEGNKMNENTPHSRRPAYNPMTHEGLCPIHSMHTNKFVNEDETLIWTLDIPGVDIEQIEVAEIGNVLRITVPFTKGEVVKQTPYEIILHEDDVVVDITLSLGQLEVVIDKGVVVINHDVREI